ncbi:unnamed protein product, partial [Musa hybrid cultivar]
MGLVPWHTFSRSYFPILRYWVPYCSVPKREVESTGFLESYTLNVPHPPNNGNLQSLRSNLYPISELARLILCSLVLIIC